MPAGAAVEGADAQVGWLPADAVSGPRLGRSLQRRPHVARRKPHRLASRYPLLFGALAVLIVALVLQTWRSLSLAGAEQAARARADEVLTAINEFESASQPLASRAMCATTGGPALSAEELAAPTWPPVLTRLTGLVIDQPEILEAVGAVRRETMLFEQSFVDPLRKACAQQQRLGAAEVQSRVRVAAPQRARVLDGIKRLRNLALERRLLATSRASEAAGAARRWLALLSLAAGLLAVSAPIVARSLSLRLSDMGRQLSDEAQEGEMAREQLVVAQRRMRVVFDHVNDAIVAFDAFGRIQWVNPAAEALFAVERKVLHGCLITQILPGIDERTRLVNSPEVSADAVIDEHGLAWTSRQFYLDGVRAQPDSHGSDRLSLELSLVLTRVDGQDVGVCVAREVTRAAAEAPANRSAFAAADVPAPQDGRTDLRELARAALESCATPAHVRDARVKFAFEPDPLWIRADPAAVQEVLNTLLLKALEVSAQGAEIAVTTLQVGQAARVVVSDAGAAIAELAVLELTGKESDGFDHAYGGNLAQARDAARAMGGAVGFRAGAMPGEQAIWAQWPLAAPTTVVPVDRVEG